jgi:hypothetical protein
MSVRVLSRAYSTDVSVGVYRGFFLIRLERLSVKESACEMYACFCRVSVCVCNLCSTFNFNHFNLRACTAVCSFVRMSA